MDRTPLRDFLEIPYDKLEEMNLSAKQQRLSRVPIDQVREERQKYLRDERRIKAVTVCFTDLEGRLHMLDYDKKFLLSASDNLTFDGSSIRGFSQQAESDLRLEVDWSAFYWLPADVFGPGKVLVFGLVEERDGTPYHADMRTRLKGYTKALFERDGTIAHASNEIEGFLFKGRDAERQYHACGQFEFLSTGGYYHSLPGDPLRLHKLVVFLEIGDTVIELFFDASDRLLIAIWSDEIVRVGIDRDFREFLQRFARQRIDFMDGIHHIAEQLDANRDRLI